MLDILKPENILKRIEALKVKTKERGGNISRGNTNDDLRRKQVLNKYKLLAGDLRSVLDKKIGDVFNADPSLTRDHKDRLDASVNLLKELSYRVPLNYADPPKRNFLQSGDFFETLYKENNIDVLMQRVERHLIGIGVAAVHIRYDVEGKELVLRLIPTSDLIYLEHPEKPEIPIAVAIKVLENNKFYWQYYDDFKQERLTEDFKPVTNWEFSGDNPIGEIPVAIVNANLESQDLLSHLQSDELFEGAINVGLALTEKAYSDFWGGMKLLAVKGEINKAMGGRLVKDNTIYVELSPNAEVTVIDSTWEPALAWENIYKMIEQITRPYGLSISQFNLVKASQSGYALQLEMTDQMNFNKRQQFSLVHIESQILRKVQKAMGDKRQVILQGIEYAVNKNDTQWQDRLDSYLKAVNGKVMSREKAIKAINPEMTDDDVAEFLGQTEEEENLGFRFQPDQF